jgi:hypothetical protein
MMTATPWPDQSVKMDHSSCEWRSIFLIDFENAGPRPNVPRKPADGLAAELGRGMMR